MFDRYQRSLIIVAYEIMSALRPVYPHLTSKYNWSESVCSINILCCGLLLVVEYYPRWTATFEISFLAVQTPTTTACCRMLPTLDHHV